MSDHKHTPGPWRFYSNADSDTRMGKIGVTTKRFDVAHCFGDSDEEAECLANTRLIAAAPEMLEALEGGGSTFVDGPSLLMRAASLIEQSTNSFRIAEAIREKARREADAIAKATGKESA